MDFFQKNNTHDGLYKINSGEKNIDSLGEIIAWKNSSQITKWQNYGNCNKIYGTDTTIFPPRRDQDSIIKVFQSDICRYPFNLGFAKIKVSVRMFMLTSLVK